MLRRVTYGYTLCSFFLYRVYTLPSFMHSHHVSSSAVNIIVAEVVKLTL